MTANQAYADFSLKDLHELPSGCIMGIVGENGAGKSTTSADPRSDSQMTAATSGSGQDNRLPN
jgi:ABC-type multidrug transport system ATPase subunit